MPCLPHPRPGESEQIVEIPRRKTHTRWATLPQHSGIGEEAKGGPPYHTQPKFAIQGDKEGTVRD